ncbi:hypothetical protein [Fulvivirga sedimenti]|uniref:Uncharacterized protein n=1 Tax=Fulvivirga sedimenti TaxID=2879465 RepID=A0A9X1HWA1_9BACT|nr:hypothetical protein [Fulvivirga sedimenti]MCA6078821.1 hypothetical protein [Fulvivirga sedimenti]
MRRSILIICLCFFGCSKSDNTISGTWITEYNKTYIFSDDLSKSTVLNDTSKNEYILVWMNDSIFYPKYVVRNERTRNLPNGVDTVNLSPLKVSILSKDSMVLSNYDGSGNPIRLKRVE